MYGCVKTLLILVNLAVCLGLTSALLADDPATRVGAIDRISKTDRGTNLDVTIRGELDQPANSQLMTGTSNPSQTMMPGGATPSVQLAVGMPVKLVIERQGAVFRYTIGVVESVIDKRHCTVKVDTASQDKTFQDPLDQNNLHKVGEFLIEGAWVAVWGATPN